MVAIKEILPNTGTMICSFASSSCPMNSALALNSTGAWSFNPEISRPFSPPSLSLHLSLCTPN
jgi:hypothetical protein